MQLDKEDIRTYEQRHFFDSSSKKEMTPLSIFFAVLAAILVAWFLRAAYIEWQIRQALAVFNQQIDVINQQNQQNIKNMQIRNEYMRWQAEEKANQRAEEIRQKKIAAQQIDFERRALQLNQINERNRKEEAWAIAYKPASGCEKENPSRDTIKCGNDYAKARKVFDASWGQ